MRMEYYVYITNRCNMNCSYCTVMMDTNKTPIPNEISYSLHSLKRFVDSVQLSRKTSDNNAVIYFFGGEPSLDYIKISEIINMFEGVTEYYVTFVLHTNGLLLDTIPKEVASRLDVVFLSLNYEKLFDKGQITSYFYNSMRNITQLKIDYQITTVGRFTVSQNTNLFTEATMSGAFFDYIYWQLDNQEHMADIEEYKRRYKEDVTMLFNYWLSFLRCGLTLQYIPFLAVIRHMINDDPTPTHSYCGYGKDMVYIQTDGTCHGCCDGIDKGLHYIGSIFKGISFKGMEINNEHCKSCNYLKICGGRCGRMHSDFCAERINDFCELSIYLFELIKTHFNEIQKLLKANNKSLEVIYDPNMDYTELIP